MTNDEKRADLVKKQEVLAAAKAATPINQVTIDAAQKAVDTAQAALD